MFVNMKFWLKSWLKEYQFIQSLGMSLLFLSLILLNGCAAPTTMKIATDETPHATISGSFTFLGFGWASCAIREVDGQTLSLPFPYSVQVSPGVHDMTIWCGGFFISAGGGENITIEFKAIAGHSYKWRMSSRKLLDETTGDVAQFTEKDELNAH